MPKTEQQQAGPAAEDGGALSAAEQAQLGELLARQQAEAGPGAARMKVEAPHISFTYGGLTVGTEYTTVPALLAGAVTTAAAEAGVTITQES